MIQIKCIGLAVFFSVAGSIEAREQQEDDPEKNTSIRHVVIEVATAETPRSDTASITELSDGRLMVVYHKYEQGKHSGHDQRMCRIWSKVCNCDPLTLTLTTRDDTSLHTGCGEPLAACADARC